MTDGGRAKFSLFSSANALNGQVECDENHRSPPKPPLSARSKPNSVKVKPKRPSSANPRLRSNPRRDPAPGRVKINKDKISQQHAIRPQTPPKRQEAQEMDSRGVVLPKEELFQIVTQLKKQQRTDESLIANLKAENQRLENELVKQQHRIDKILSPHFAKNTHLVLEIRREIEKSVLVRQLKAQMQSLRATVAERDSAIESLQKSSSATHLMEMAAEKEEYFAEIKRLERIIAKKDKEIDNYNQSRAWEKSGDNPLEVDLRQEIDRLSKGYQMVLERLEEKVGSRDASPRSDRRPDSESGSRPLHQSKPQQGGTSRPKSAATNSFSSRTIKKSDAAVPSDQALSESALNTQLVRDPTALDFIDPILISFDDRRSNPKPAEPTPAVRNVDTTTATTRPGVTQSINYSLLEMSEEPEIEGGGIMQVVGDSAAGWVPAGALPMGCRVEIRPKDGSQRAIAGRICGNSGGQNGTYDIDLDNGARELAVPRDRISVVGEPNAVFPVDAIFKVGDKVEGNYRASGSWYSATVKAVHPDGTYTIEYDDGDMERNVQEINLAALSSGRKSASKGTVAETPPAPSKFVVKEKVSARYRGNTKWYPGEIKRVHGDGTFDVLYDDGEEEHHVSEALIEKVQVSLVLGELAAAVEPAVAAPSANIGEYSVGEKVEGRFRGRAKWYPAKIVRVREDGQYDIDYDDGEEERRVSGEFIRRRPPPEEGPVQGDIYAVGDLVLGNFAGEGDFFSGVVRAKKRSGDKMLYEILYDDGDTESGVEAVYLKPRPPVDVEPISSTPDPVAQTEPKALSASSDPASGLAQAEPITRHIVPEDDLNDFLAGLSDDDEGDVEAEGEMIGGGLDAGGSQYDVGGDEYGEDFDE